MKNSKGFSLIELVVVIVILGILVAVGIPKYVDLTTKAKKARDDAQLSALRSSTHLLYAKNALDGNATFPAQGAVESNLTTYAGTWEHYTTVTYSQADGSWTATTE